MECLTSSKRLSKGVLITEQRYLSVKIKSRRIHGQVLILFRLMWIEPIEAHAIQAQTPTGSYRPLKSVTKPYGMHSAIQTSTIDFSRLGTCAGLTNAIGQD